MPKAKIYTVDGVTGTLTQICDHFGIKKETAKHRLRRGMSVEEAIKTPVRSAKQYTVNGFTGSLKEVSEHFGASYSVVEQRLKSGMS